MVNQQAEKKKADPKEDEAKAAAAKAKAAEDAKKITDEAANKILDDPRKRGSLTIDGNDKIQFGNA